MEIRLAAPLQSDSIVDGEGIRAVVWTQGCLHNCPGCHNPETFSFEGGYLVDMEEIKQDISNLVGHNGVTFSGGDPMFQPEQLRELAKHVKSLGMNVWVYTGFTYEALIKDEKRKKALDYIDVLVDGPFLIKLFSLDLFYKGSSNQRIIDVQETLKQNQVVVIEKYKGKKDFSPLYKKDDNLYI